MTRFMERLKGLEPSTSTLAIRHLVSIFSRSHANARSNCRENCEKNSAAVVPLAGMRHPTNPAVSGRLQGEMYLKVLGKVPGNGLCTLGATPLGNSNGVT